MRQKSAENCPTLEAAIREALAACTEPKVYRILDVALQEQDHPPVTELDFINFFIRSHCTSMSVAEVAKTVLREYELTPLQREVKRQGRRGREHEEDGRRGDDGG